MAQKTFRFGESQCAQLLHVGFQFLVFVRCVYTSLRRWKSNFKRNRPPTSAVGFRYRNANGGLWRHALESALTVACMATSTKPREEQATGQVVGYLALDLLSLWSSGDCTVKSVSHALLTSPKGLVVLEILSSTGIRHNLIFHTNAWCCPSPACSYLIWSEHFATQPQSTVLVRTQARKKRLCSCHRHFHSTYSPGCHRANWAPAPRTHKSFSVCVWAACWSLFCHSSVRILK
jgi:hypothetical protein